MNQLMAFEQERMDCLHRMRRDTMLQSLARAYMDRAETFKYSYGFKWLGLPIIQYPQDIIALQEIMWTVQPDLIIETGIAHGGSLVFYASMLELLGGDGKVLGIDIDIRSHNRVRIEAHPLFDRIEMIEGSSVDSGIVREVFEYAKDKTRIMVVLDSNHTHDHVLSEMIAYSPLIKKGGYLIVLDTVVELMPENFFPNRPWGRGNNPKTAVQEFLQINHRFEVDHDTSDKLAITVAPGGYLRCTSNG